MSVHRQRLARASPCALGLLLCAHAALAAPVISWERPISDVAAEQVARMPVAPGVASNQQGEYLVVWQRTQGVQAARVAADGTLLSPGIFTVAASGRPPATEHGPSVAFDGTRYVVAWGADFGIRVARIEQDGTVLDPGGRPVAQYGRLAAPRIGCHAGACMVVWEREDPWNPDDEDPPPTTYDSRGLRLRADLTPIDTSELVISPEYRRPSVAAGPGGFLVVANGMLPTLYPLDGPPVSRGFRPVSGNQARAVSLGTRWLVVWGVTTLEGAVVDPAITGSHRPFVITTGSSLQASPSVTFDGVHALVSWIDESNGRSAFSARLDVSRNGKVLPPGRIPLPAQGYSRQATVEVASGGPGLGFLAVLQASPDSFFRPTAIGLRLAPDGTSPDPTPIPFSFGPPEQLGPSAAHGYGEDLVVWSEARDDTGSALYAVRIRPDGSQSGPELRLPAAPGSTSPSVAYDGTNFLIAWEEPAAGGTDIRGARVSGAGRLLDTTSIALSTAPGVQRRPAVAYAAKRLWVIWEDERHQAPGNGADIYGTRVRPAGLVMDPDGLRLSPLGGTQRAPALAALEPNLLVVWEALAPHGDTDIRGTRVKWDGTVLDPSGLGLSSALGRQGAPKVASTGARALVVWEDEAEGRPRVVGTRVLATGQVLEPGGLALAPDSPAAQRRPALVFDGEVWLVAWEAASIALPFVEGVRLREDGTAEAPGVLTLSMAYEAEGTPVLSSDGAGVSALFYQRHVEVTAIPSARLRFRLLYPAGSIWTR